MAFGEERPQTLHPVVRQPIKVAHLPSHHRCPKQIFPLKSMGAEPKAFPSTTTELLTEWENTPGLPDPRAC
ncbi:hypothetical protein B932_0691 [Gluconobacter oxydans H24]|nr:hypothetical protein B932_0691 [Gluconobacter oxydans H24]GAC89478.1 hypothetical protein NBRC3255_3139 [Gluconobacter thailandicus NBRC 3255]